MNKTTKLTAALLMAGVFAGGAIAQTASATSDVPVKAGEASTQTNGVPNMVTNNNPNAAAPVTSASGVVVDNAGAHKPERIRALVEAAGCRLVFLPAYSPDLSPVEEAFSKIKALVKAAGARTRAALDAAIAVALAAVTASDAAGWFTHAGYPTSQAA